MGHGLGVLQVAGALGTHTQYKLLKPLVDLAWPREESSYLPRGQAGGSEPQLRVPVESQPGPFNGSCQAGRDPTLIRRTGRWREQPSTSQERLSSLLTGNRWSSVASIYQADVISSVAAKSPLPRVPR